MALARTIARRSLLQRPGRTLFSTLGIAIGVATVVAVITLDHNTILGFSLRYQVAGAPDLELRPAQGSAGAPLDLEKVEGVSAVSAFFQNDVFVRSDARDGGEAIPQRVRLFALEASALESLDVHRVSAGRGLMPGAPREVLVGESLADSAGVAIGDTLFLTRPERVARRACEEGVLREPVEEVEELPEEQAFTVVGLLAREKLGHRSRGDVVIVDYAWARELFSGVHVDARYWGRRDPTVDVERLRASLGQSYSYQLNRTVILGQAADERAFRTGVRTAGLLALVLGLFVIFHTLSMSIVERVAEVGTLHALGVSRAQIARIFLLEATVLAGAGALFGLVLGLGLARLLLARGITTLGTGKVIDVFEVPWMSVLPLAAVGFGVALCGSVYPLVRIRGANTVAALRGQGALAARGVTRGFQLFTALLLAVILPGLYFVLVPVVGAYSAPLVGALLTAVGFLTLLVAIPLLMPSLIAGVCAVLTRPFAARWPLAGRLAATNMRSSAGRVAVNASAIALVSAGFVGLKGMTRSLRGEVEVWAAEAALDKVWVSNLPALPWGPLKEHLAPYPGVVGVEKGSVRAYVPFLMIGVDPGQLAAYGPAATDPSLISALANGNGVILSRRLAADLGYEIGDPVQVGRSESRVAAFRVVAITDAYGYFPHPDERLYGLVADHHLKRLFCLDVDEVTSLGVRLEPGADTGVVQAALTDFMLAGNFGGGGGGRGAGRGPARFETGAELLARHVEDIDRDFVLFDVLILLTAILAGLGVLNGQLLSALERTKEIGVLKALGVERRQVAGMVLLESLVVGLVGGAVGIALGTFLTPIVVRALEELAGLALPHAGAGPWIPASFAAAAGIALLAGLYPIWRMNRFDALRAVRTG